MILSVVFHDLIKWLSVVFAIVSFILLAFFERGELLLVLLRSGTISATALIIAPELGSAAILTVQGYGAGGFVPIVAHQAVDYLKRVEEAI